MLAPQNKTKSRKSKENRQIVNLCFFVTLFCVFVYGCASIRLPNGGAKDLDPPKILKIDPPQLSKNFSAKKISFLFDEYFKIQNEHTEFSISPEQPVPPTLKVNGKKLDIIFNSPLEENTTYTLNFGKAIGDVNEGNVLKNFKYVFSTGNKIDSLSIQGKVTDALTNAPTFDALVFIYPVAQDTLFGKKKPSVFTRTDSLGRYTLSNLHEGKIRVYALKEANGDGVYQQGEEEIAFLKDTINLTKNIDSLNFRLFKENPSVFRDKDRGINGEGTIFINFNKKLKNPYIKVVDPTTLDENKKIVFNEEKDSVRIWLKKLDFDSVKLAIFDGNKELKKISIRRAKTEEYIRKLQPKDNLSSAQVLNPFLPFKLIFSTPIEKVNRDKITLLEDTIAKTNFIIEQDSIDFLSYSVKYPWLTNKFYTLKFPEGAFVDQFNTKNKAFTKKFSLGKKEDYGSLGFKIMVTKEQPYILEVFDEENNIVKRTSFTKNTSVTILNLPEKKYFVRIVYDANKNGLWDGGVIESAIQPEKTWYFKKEISVRANWERNETFTVPE